MWFTSKKKKEEKPRVASAMGLTLAFEDSKGQKYYYFPEKDVMTINRLGEIMTVLDEINCGLSEKELTQLVEYGESGLQAKKGESIDLTKVAFAFTQIKSRKEMLVHPDLMLKLLGWIYVREDEDPFVISKPIHVEKCKQFQEDIEKGEHSLKDFFLQQHILGWCPFLNGITEELEPLWEEGLRKTKGLQTFLTNHQNHSPLK